MGAFPSEIGNSREWKHGAKVSIGLHQTNYQSNDRLFHETWDAKTFPVVRSYVDGMRIGCTFISNEALRKIWDWHQDFSAATSKTHQQGAE